MPPYVKIYRKKFRNLPPKPHGKKGGRRGRGGIVVEQLLTLFFSYVPPRVRRGSALISDDFIMPAGGTPSAHSDL